MIRLSQKNKKTYNYYLVLDDEHSLDHKIVDKKVRRLMLRLWAYKEKGGPKTAEDDDDPLYTAK